MPTLYFGGDQVAFFDAIDESGSKSVFGGVTAPFAPTDLIEIVIHDADVGPDGEFDANLVRFESVTVLRDGERFEFQVDPGSRIKESGGGGAKEQGDTFFTTNDEVSAPSSGPFAGVGSGKLVFSTDTSFQTGQTATIKQAKKQDLNDDGDFKDPGEGKNGTFNAKPANKPPCFASGTLILTPQGERPVEALRAGDHVTLSSGETVPILLAASFYRRLRGPQDPSRPVVVPAGALGPGRPSRPLRLSPQHCLAVSGTQLPELLAAGAGRPLPHVRAKALCGYLGVEHPPTGETVVYHALLLPRHAALVADGAEALSLWPGPNALRALGAAHVRALEGMFPGLSRAPERVYGPQGTTLPRWAVRRALRDGPRFRSMAAE